MRHVHYSSPMLCVFSLGDKRLEYEKLHRALKKSHEQEKRLIKKCRELNGEIVNNAAKVQTALKLSQEDQATIGSLRKEIEKAWTMVDVAHEKEGGVARLHLHCQNDNSSNPRRTCRLRLVWRVNKC